MVASATGGGFKKYFVNKIFVLLLNLKATQV
jgi:hypothetical protein